MRFSAIARFALPIVIIAALVYWIPAEHKRQLWEQPKRYPWIGFALLTAIIALAISFARWCVLVRAMGIRLSMVEAFRLSSIGFMLSLVSAGAVGGDLFKGIFLAKRRPGRRFEAFSSIFVDRGCGLLGLCLLAAAGLCLIDVDATGASSTDGSEGIAVSITAIRTTVVTLVAIGVAVLAVLLVGGRWVDASLGRLETVAVVGGLVSRIARPIRAFCDRPFAIVVGIAMSVLVQGLFAISFYGIAVGLYRDVPTMAEHLVVVPTAMLISTLPLTPGGVGLLEAAMVAMYAPFTDEPEIKGFAVALVFEVVKLVMAVIGVLFYWTAPDEVRTSLDVANEEESTPETQAAA